MVCLKRLITPGLLSLEAFAFLCASAPSLHRSVYRRSNYVKILCNGAWDAHIKRVVENGRKKVNQLHSVISNRGVNLSARRLLLLSVVRPTLEYGSEVWEGNKSQTAAVMLGGAKRILGCSSKTCNEAVRGDMGLETLQGRRDKSKLKVWYKLASMSEDRYPRRVFSQDWDAKPRRGRQRKVWSRLVDNLFGSLDLDKAEWLDEIEKGDSSLKAFLAMVEESIGEREREKFVEGLTLYKCFGREVQFKKYLHGLSDAGTRLLCKFRSGTHGLNEELGRHRGREGRKSVCCVGMSVKVLVIHCGIVQHIQVVEGKPGR